MNYPRASILWPGAILGTVVKSIATAIHPEFDSFLSWSGNNYVVQGWDGRYGAITFAGPQGNRFDPKRSAVVGAFYSNRSTRCPTLGTNQTALNDIFRNCPDRHRQLAQQGALQFLLFEAHPGGPCATAAFWNNEEVLDASEPWHAVLENGADLLGEVLIENPEQALLNWNKEFHLSEEQLDLAWSIYNRLIDNQDHDIRLTPSEGTLLGALSDDSIAIKECTTSFADIGVIVP